MTVAEHGSITKAASALHMEQPPLSRHISHLEKRLGLMLFSRSRAGVTLTNTGREIYAKSVDVLRNHEAFSEYTKSLSSAQSSNINIGLSDGILTKNEINKKINLFINTYPQCKISLSSGSQETTLGRVIKGKIDCAVIWGHVRIKEIICRKYTKSKLYAAVNVNNNKQSFMESDVRSLMDENLFLYGNSEETYMFESLRKRYATEGVSLSLGQPAKDMLSALTLVSLGIGSTIVPFEISVLNLENVLYLPIRGGNMFCDVSIVYRKSTENSALKKLINVLDVK